VSLSVPWQANTTLEDSTLNHWLAGADAKALEKELAAAEKEAAAVEGELRVRGAAGGVIGGKSALHRPASLVGGARGPAH
jgi:hypothetical protein